MRVRAVYFLRQINGLGPVKIGSAFDVQARLDHYNRVAPYELRCVAKAPGTYRDEHFIHACFWADRTHQEWFRPSPELEALIGDVATTGKLDLSADHLKPHPDYHRAKAVWTAEMRANQSANLRQAWAAKTGAA